MNANEQTAAEHILKMTVTSAKYATDYLRLMQAVKLRKEVELLDAKINEIKTKTKSK